MHDSTFTIDGVDYEVEWEMEGQNPIWSLVGDDTTHGPNLTPAIQDKIDEAVWEYMEDWWRGMDDYS